MNFEQRKKEIRGTNVSLYSQIHYWIRKNYGKADHCEKCFKSSKRYNWALINGKNYDFNVDNFIQLCRSCHAKMDCDYLESGKKMSKIQKDMVAKGIHHLQKRRRPVAKLTPDEKILETYPSQTEAVVANGLSHGRLSINLDNGKKYHGFLWRRI